MPATSARLLSCELLPVVSPSSAYTVLHSALAHYSRQNNTDKDSIPLPSPHPASVHGTCTTIHFVHYTIHVDRNPVHVYCINFA